MGKDSLGVWLSDWKWNSSIGKERWQEAFILDMCRGSLLAQVWSDGPWLSPPERKQITEFIALLRAQPECFASSRFILGNPWNNEVYGYCCADGKRAFITIHNYSWSDASVQLELNTTWGLSGEKDWDIYRWYPEPARLQGETEHFGGQVSISLRPFTVVLLEVVPAGETPSIEHRFVNRQMLSKFDEPSRELEISVSSPKGQEPALVSREIDKKAPDNLPLWPKRVISIKSLLQPSSRNGTLVFSVESFKASASFVMEDIGRYFAINGRLSGKEVECEPVVRERTLPASWQAWRIPVGPSTSKRDIELLITVMAPEDVDQACKGYFLPM